MHLTGFLGSMQALDEDSPSVNTKFWSPLLPRRQSRSGAPSGNRCRNGRPPSTARATDGRLSRRLR